MIDVKPSPMRARMVRLCGAVALGALLAAGPSAVLAQNDAAAPADSSATPAAGDAAQPAAPKIPCDEAQDYFSGQLEAELDEWEARALAGHLEACAECRLALKQLEAQQAVDLKDVEKRLQALLEVVRQPAPKSKPPRAQND